MNDDVALAIQRSLADEMAAWRKKRGLSRAELAAQAGVSDSTIGRYERAESSPNVTDSMRIAEALGIDFTDLIRRAQEAVQIDRARGVFIDGVRRRSADKSPEEPSETA